LEALARSAEATTLFVASCYDAQRAQLFGGLFRRKEHQLERIGDEVVTSPDDFAAIVDREANSDRVTWVSLDPELIQNLELVQRRTAAGDLVLPGSVELASTIGKIAAERAAKGEFSDSLNLDANYVRRSDAEIFWKGPAARVR
jgi:tRNA A37 threonylcarbamoyladenosine modification protein TsaB